MDKRFILLIAALFCCPAIFAAGRPVIGDFHKKIQPILQQYCSDCHADGANKGGVAFDEFKSNDSILASNKLWFAVLKNIRAGIMPPEKKPRPTAAEINELESWIKYDAFGIDPAHPDPGRVTVRRLNRVEYRNTIRDLMGVDYDTIEEFPPDDAGYGFDDIGDVLTLPTMLLEKYLDAARTIIGETVPTTGWIMPETILPGYNFRRDLPPGSDAPLSAEILSYYEKATLTNHFHIEHAGHYEIVTDISAHEHFVEGQFDYNKCRLIFKLDGRAVWTNEYSRQDSRLSHPIAAVDMTNGTHEIAFELEPLTPATNQVRSLTLHVETVTVRGPSDQKFWKHPKDYARYFPKDVPSSADERRAYARELLERFASRAFRRPADSNTVDRLVKLAEDDYAQPGKTFEAGIAHAMIAVLASPRFLFREEHVEAHSLPGTQQLIDEYSLASRLSYFLWSSMPDDELIRLAREGNLRKNLSAQVARMLTDQRAQALSKNFVGQWLQSRDIETVNIESQAVVMRDEKPDLASEELRRRFWHLKEKGDSGRTAIEQEEYEKIRPVYIKAVGYTPIELGGELRTALRHETESYFSGIVREDRDVIELVDSDYTYLNDRLAKYYNLTNLGVTGSELRRVQLPADCPRGGVLTMGSVLAVTSNPTRTSAVKRGLFILDNILGNPTPPPPPNIAPLEISEKEMAHASTLRDVLAVHRDKPMCNSCHGRMDPLGLALENFNALGVWRNWEHGEKIDSTGKFITGETFGNVHELKHILATNHRVEFYRTLTEKLLTYALGRGLDYMDVETVDQIAERMQKNNGHFSALLYGIIESTPFQMRRESGRLASNDVSRRESN